MHRYIARVEIVWLLLVLACLAIGAVVTLIMGRLGAINDTRQDGGDG